MKLSNMKRKNSSEHMCPEGNFNRVLPMKFSSPAKGTGVKKRNWNKDEEEWFCEKQKASITTAENGFQSLHEAILAIVCIACTAAFVSADL